MGLVTRVVVPDAYCAIDGCCLFAAPTTEHQPIRIFWHLLATDCSRLAARAGLGYHNDMTSLDRISIDPTVRFGKACIRGTRLTVGEVLGYLASGMSEEEVLASFPQLTHEDVLACLAYAAERERRTLSIPAA
jgi:uncharacterized protein (DUF433 family)